ncbi:hypothetical protein IWX81_000110 [Salinibacterium sp. CAN_S4]|uniref:hypothetical protein n=1 Tax=Salinibacterium sp. CAN_S4 TaxID=2787727 RepID=UPI0018EFFA74
MMRQRLAAIPGLKSGIAAFLLVFMASGGAVAANAYWSATTAVSGAARAASFGMTAGDFAALNTTYMYKVAETSPIVIKPISVSNTGSAPLTFSLAVANTNPTLAPAVRLWLWTTGSSNCGATPLNTPGTLAAPPVMPSGASAGAANSTLTLCAATQLAGTVATSQGQSVSATFTVTGRVGSSSWIANATGTTTQTVFRIAAPVPVCRQTATQGFLREGYVTLSWPSVAGATGYQVFVDTPGSPLSATPVRTLTAATLAATVRVAGGDANISADSSIRIMSTDSLYGTSQAAAIPVNFDPSTFFGLIPASTLCAP